MSVLERIIKERLNPRACKKLIRSNVPSIIQKLLTEANPYKWSQYDININTTAYHKDTDTYIFTLATHDDYDDETEVKLCLYKNENFYFYDEAMKDTILADYKGKLVRYALHGLWFSPLDVTNILLDSLVGKKVSSFSDEIRDSESYRREKIFTINFSDDTTLIFSHEQECCEQVWFDENSSSELNTLTEGVIVKAEVREVDLSHQHDDSGDYKAYFYEIVTSRGGAHTLVFRGESNGYYSIDVDVHLSSKVIDERLAKEEADRKWLKENPATYKANPRLPTPSHYLAAKADINENIVKSGRTTHEQVTPFLIRVDGGDADKFKMKVSFLFNKGMMDEQKYTYYFYHPDTLVARISENDNFTKEDEKYVPIDSIDPVWTRTVLEMIRDKQVPDVKL